MKAITILLLLIFQAGLSVGQYAPQGYLPDMYQTDAIVQDIVRYNNRYIVAGNFTYWGPKNGSGGILDLATGQFVQNNVHVIGPINTVISDQNGGWYIGGDFLFVNGIPRTRLAHILADFSLDMAFAPTADSAVNAMVLDGPTLYVGGKFMNINGQRQTRIAAINSVTGASITYTVYVDGEIEVLAQDRTRLYMAGKFQQIGSNYRPGLGAVVRRHGGVTPWSPEPRLGGSSIGVVKCIISDDNTVYIGGAFDSVDGQPAQNLAATDWLTGGNWANAPAIKKVGFDQAVVNSMVMSNGVLYIAGSFDSVGTVARKNIAAIELLFRLPTSWSPNVITQPDGAISQLEIYNGSAYIIGQLGVVGTNRAIRRWFTSIDLVTGQASALNPMSNSRYKKDIFAISNNHAFLGGQFTSYNGKERIGFAELDVNTGHLIDGPHINISIATTQQDDFKQIRDVLLDGSTLYIAGRFDSINGQVRSNLAAIDLATGQLTAWQPVINGSISCITKRGTDLFIGGSFSQINGQTRNNLASFDLTNGQLTGWINNTSGPIYTMAVSRGLLFVGGSFSSINGLTRSNAAIVNTSRNGGSMSFASFNGSINSMLGNDSLLIISGAFNQVDNSSQGGLCIYNVNSASMVYWDPYPLRRGAFRFTTIGLTDRSLLVHVPSAINGNNSPITITEYDLNTLQPTTWKPMLTWDPDYSVACFFKVIDQSVLISGGFVGPGNDPRHGVGLYSQSSSPVFLPRTTAVNEMSLYPNPATSAVEYRFKNNETVLQLRIYNQMGREVQHTNPVTGNRLNISNLPQGIYQVVAKTVSGTFTERLVVE